MHSVFNGMSEHNMLLLDLTECTSMIACCHISTIFQVGCRVIYSLVLIQPTVYDRKRRLLKGHRQQGSHLCVLPVWQQHMCCTGLDKPQAGHWCGTGTEQCPVCSMDRLIGCSTLVPLRELPPTFKAVGSAQLA